MKTIEFSAQLVDDKFTLFGSNADAVFEEVLPEIIRQLAGKGGEADLQGYRVLVAHQLTNPDLQIQDLRLQLSSPDYSLQDLEWQVTNPGLKLEDLNLKPTNPDAPLDEMTFKITNPRLALQDLILRAKSPQLTLQDQRIQSGMYLIFIKPSVTLVNLALYLPNQKPNEGWQIRQQEALIGRRDEEKGIFPEVDLTPHLRNPLKISRQQAWLQEDEGKWKIRLHAEARSLVYVDNVRLEPERSIELRNDTVLNIGNNPENPELRLFVRLFTD